MMLPFASGIEANVDDDGRNGFANLSLCGQGRADPNKLRDAAMSAVVERSHYSHDISPERRAV